MFLWSMQNIPETLKGKSGSDAVKVFISGDVGTLIAAMFATFGIYFIASFLYVDVVLPL